MLSIREFVDSEYARRHYKNLEGTTSHWRVSSLGMPFDSFCRRTGASPDPLEYVDPHAPLNKDGSPKKLTEYDISRGGLIMNMGTGIHSILQDIVASIDSPELEILGIETPEEPEATQVSNDEYGVQGHYDMYLKFTKLDHKVLYDIKTIHEMAYSHMKREGKGIIKPYPHHVKQLLAYDWIMGQEADELRLFYVDRNNGRREEIPVERNPDILQEVFDEWDMLNKCLETNTPPPAPEPVVNGKPNFPYKYSNYKAIINEGRED